MIRDNKPHFSRCLAPLIIFTAAVVLSSFTFENAVVCTQPIISEEVNSVAISSNNNKAVVAEVITSHPSSSSSSSIATSASTVSSSVVDFSPIHPDFIPTHEWAEVLDGQLVPGGLEIRFDLEQGKKYAKLPSAGAPPLLPTTTGGSHDDFDDNIIPSMHVPVDEDDLIVSSQVEPNVLWGTDLDVTEDDLDEPFPEITNLTDNLKQLLLDLPQPEPELIQGLQSQLSEEKMDEIYRRVWMKRQEEIRQAFKATRNDADFIKRLLGVLVRGRADQEQSTIETGLQISTAEEQVQALIDLEFMVSDLDHAGNFFHLGGLNVIADSLTFARNHESEFQRLKQEYAAANMDIVKTSDNAEELLIKEAQRMAFNIRAKSAWVLGTAVKNIFTLQDIIADSMVVHDALNLITDAYIDGYTSEASTGLYCLGAMLRHNPAAQTQFFEIGGIQRLKMLLLQITEESLQSECHISEHANSCVESNEKSTEQNCEKLSELQVQFINKAMAMVSDLVESSMEETRPTAVALYTALKADSVTWVAIALRSLQCASITSSVEKALIVLDTLMAVDVQFPTTVSTTVTQVLNQTIHVLQENMVNVGIDNREYVSEVIAQVETMILSLAP